jgi:stalled ribosome rescue protein Dom34
MSKHFHALVWLDHREARVLHFNATEVERSLVHAHADQHIHHKANSVGSGHASVDQEYLKRVAEAIGDAGAVLITGPANAKTELMAHITRHDPALVKRISGVQAADHPDDGALLARGRAFFKFDDRMHPQR